MGTYAIGDLQGCCRELNDLLDKINFDKKNDRLWFTGDIVNRGPESLECLRLVRKLDAVMVLGNHDLHLLAVAAGKANQRKKDTLGPVLEASDRTELLDWLKTRPLLYRDQDTGVTLVHAGLSPQWNISQACDLAKEVESMVQGEHAGEFYANMYGDLPDLWNDDLEGWERLRFITNCMTRIRYCEADGRINMKEKGAPGSQSEHLLPWYMVAGRRSEGENIIFGHWATIYLGVEQDFHSAGVHALDTGCVWGGKLTAMRIEDGKYFSVRSRQKKRR